MASRLLMVAREVSGCLRSDAMPKRYDPHANQIRNLAIGLVAFVCLVMAGALALVG
jgi:hypothetical protein